MGDKGESVFGKIVLPKSDAIFEALGCLDELNAVIGFCKTEARKNPSAGGKKIAGNLHAVQHVLFIIQAEVAAARFNFRFEKRLTEESVVQLEKKIADIDRQIPEITKFVIPGGSELSSRLELARTAARKSERIVVKYKSKISPNAITYLNRLSSYLFALARFVNFKLKIKEENPKY
ncbi:MAG: cob(I)yrinic acid a,c-diamide adenosyltransferase [Minisyncoccia bacterium]|jgi:cob(I)alamin adenosyltransferase